MNELTQREKSESVASVLAGVARLLAMVPLEELEAHVRFCATNLERSDAFGCFTDPTQWMRDRDSGKREDAGNQLAIVRGLLAARVAIEKREARVAELREKGAAPPVPGQAHASTETPLSPRGEGVSSNAAVRAADGPEPPSHGGSDAS